MSRPSRRRPRHSGSVYQTKDGTWRGAVSLDWTADGKPRRKYVSGKTKTEVRRKVEQLVSEHQRGIPIATSSPAVATFLEEWLEHVVKPKRRRRTYEAYESIVRVHLIPAIGRHKLERLTALQVQAMLNEKRAAGVSGRTVYTIRAVLRAALNQALRWDMVPRNVATLTDAPTPDDFEAKPIPAEDVARLLPAAKGDRLEALWLLAVWLGLRQGELFGLRWSDVDLDGRSLKVRKQLQWAGSKPRTAQLVDLKTERSKRTIPLPAPLVTALRHHLRRQLEERLIAGDRWQGEAWGLVFCSTIGTPLDPSNVTKQYRALLQAAGLEQRRF
ncbi:MAG TPA: tyrosine-type recombinase/integrase, partial [Chloroflexota bacterium]|nr:tyrosine-type recombinase/integrase [Chloroflexota bacterium]